MVEGKGRFDWAQTSSLMALAVNLMRDPKKGKAVSPNDFNPFAEKPQKIVLKGAEMLDALKRRIEGGVHQEAKVRLTGLSWLW